MGAVACEYVTFLQGVYLNTHCCVLIVVAMPAVRVLMELDYPGWCVGRGVFVWALSRYALNTA